MLVNGRWTSDWHPVQATDSKGGFVRQTSSFRHFVTPDGRPGPTGDGGFRAEPGRYHLHVALICPWASRTLAARCLKRLEDVVSVSIVEPALTEEGWRFPDAGDPVTGATYVHELYTRADPSFTGRATVPVLWDRERRTIVNNESADILRILDRGFGDLAAPDVNLHPDHLASEMAALEADLYVRLNNGVYRAGFATTQIAYEEAVVGVFAMLDDLEARMADGRRFLFGDEPTGSDIRLFVTLVRFDAAYHGLFKCNLKRIADYGFLSRFIETMLALPGIPETVSIDHIKRGYYSIRALNPNAIVPVGPRLPFEHALTRP